MPQYFFILGQNRNLSIAEIAGKFAHPVDFIRAELANEALIVELKKELNPALMLNGLGGAVKIGEILKPIDNLKQLMAKEALAIFSFKNKKKIFFGFSHYGFLNDSKFKSQIQKLALAFKKELKEQGIASRWVTSKEARLSSVVVKKNRLLEQGAEIIFIQVRNILYLGRTLAVQKFADYSFRDYGRPARDQVSGMLPPKLAKIMINLAKVPKSALILDPFCGSGTILSEAALLGYQNLIGADISQRAIEDSKANLKWLKENYKFQISNFKLLNINVRNLSQEIAADSIDAVVTEPYLGPTKPLRSEEEARKAIAELSELYLETFQEFKKFLKPQAKIVIILPIFKVKNKFFQLLILDEIRKLGFKTEPFLPSFWPPDLIKTTARGSIIYSRPGQYVLREVFVFTLNQSH